MLVICTKQRAACSALEALPELWPTIALGIVQQGSVVVLRLLIRPALPRKTF